MYKNILYRAIIITLTTLLFLNNFSYAQILNIKDIRQKVKEIREKLPEIYNFGVDQDIFEALYNSGALYIEPIGICVYLVYMPPYEMDFEISEDHLNKFFSSLWKVFGLSRFPDNTSITFYISLFSECSLIIKFPMGVFYDYFRRERITRSEFLKQCEIWVNGEKAIIEGEIIKVLGKEFKMKF